MKSLIFLFILISFNLSFSQVGIGTTTPDASSMLDIESTESGILIPRMTELDRNAILSPAIGLLVYQIDNISGFYYYDGLSWIPLSSSSNDQWKIDGNNNIDASVNFIGTTNDIDVIFKRNNLQAAALKSFSTSFGVSALNPLSTGANNSAFGTNSMAANGAGNRNVAFGDNTLAVNIGGSANTAIGYNCMASAEFGGFNTAVGDNAMANSLNTVRNTVIGAGAMQANTTGGYNVAVGYYSLNRNEIGGANTAVGEGSLERNISGSNNVAVGRSSMRDNTTGNFNTSLGVNSLVDNTTGRDNTAIGNVVLDANTTGSYNTAVGSFSYNNFNNYSNSTALGYQTNIVADNTIRLGNISITSIGGYTNWTNISDKRFKKNIKEDIAGLEFILKLRPVSYNLDTDTLIQFQKTPDSVRLKKFELIKSNEKQTGFIAQEVERAANEIGFDFHGIDKPQNKYSHYGLRYAEFVVPLVKAIQEQQEIIISQKKEIETLNKRLSRVEALLPEE